MTLVADFNPAVAVTFQRMRALLLEGGGGLQEGVLGAGDLKVAARGGREPLRGRGGRRGVGDDRHRRAQRRNAHLQRRRVQRGAVHAGHATLPRIDQVILRYNDSAIPTGAGNTPTIEVLTGTATSGATLDNRLGATALPNDCVRLCDVLMPAVAASVTTANIRDRRPWARGPVCCEAPTVGPNASRVVTTAVPDGPAAPAPPERPAARRCRARTAR
jgi:hypothetical protein